MTPDQENDSNPFAIAGFVLSFVSGPLGLIFSIIGLRRSPAHRNLAIAGIVLSFVWTFVGVVALLSVMNGGSAPDDGSLAAQPTGTTVTVAPEILRADQPPSGAPEATVAQLQALSHDAKSARGTTFVLAGEIQHADAAEAVAEVHPDDERATPTARVLLRGALLNDVFDDDQFRATVTVTGTIAKGLPVLTVSDIETL
jgi:hypothetical protein